MSGCWQLARRWHCLGAQVFIILAKDKEDSFRVMPAADEKESSLIHRATCMLGSLNPDSESCAAWQWTVISKRLRQVTDLTRPKCCILAVFAFLSGSHREDIADAALRSLTKVDQLQTTTTSVRQHHLWLNTMSQTRILQTLLPTVALAKITCEHTTVNNFYWSWSLGSQWGVISKVKSTNRPRTFDEEQHSKLGNSLMLGFFLYQCMRFGTTLSAGSSAEDYV